MTEKDEILATLRAALPDLKRRWPIRSLAVFGSVARGEASAASDVDLSWSSSARWAFPNSSHSKMHCRYWSGGASIW
jgi:predicted nucleotidyltransferase